jgi:hypothetical protein
MEDDFARMRSIVKEELEALLAEMERREVEAGHVPSPPRFLARRLRWGLEMAGALLMGLLCGILSHAGVVLLARALL